MSMTDEIREGYAAYSRRDFSFADEIFADDIAWSVPNTPPLQGRAAVLEFFGGLGAMFESHTIRLNDAIELDGRLICFCTHEMQRAGAEPVAFESVMDWRFRDGKFTSLHEVADSLSFAIAAGFVSPDAVPQPA
jgi:ketosteroid isomerase-like protein